MVKAKSIKKNQNMEIIEVDKTDEITAEFSTPDELKKEELADIKFVTLQHIGGVRCFTVHKHKVIKIHRGAEVMGGRLSDNIILHPGCVVDVTPELAAWLLDKRDFQKYGVN